MTDTRSNTIKIFNDVIQDDEKSKILERGIFNSTIKWADDNKYNKLWTDINFKSYYKTKCMSLYYNLKKIPDQSKLFDKIKDSNLTTN